MQPLVSQKPNQYKNLNSLGKFKQQIKMRKPTTCTCKLCKAYYTFVLKSILILYFLLKLVFISYFILNYLLNQHKIKLWNEMKWKNLQA